MKLLLVTQAVDTENLALGFMVRWIEELSNDFEHIEVICLFEGKHELPENVTVHSLGKERGAASHATYSLRFLSFAWRLRGDYDTVFVHMNQEYILIAGWLWKLLGKPIFMWRNHYAGTWLTDVAASFCTNVFCTSKHSYTAKYPKTIFMPVGVDTTRFCADARIARKPHSILFLARMSPSKRPEMLIDALALLAQKNINFSATFVGSPLPQDESFYESLKQSVTAKGLADKIFFLPGVPNSQTIDLYRAHEICVNTSRSGMLDKTIFESAACGCLSLAASADWAAEVGSDLSFVNGDANILAEKLTALLLLTDDQREERIAQLHAHIEKNSLAHLVDVLSEKLKSPRAEV